ncbi:MAG: hypothetical protein WDA74_04785, partial [Spirochaetota bacterium]
IEHGIYLAFEEDAINDLKTKSFETGLKIKDLCNKSFGNYFHGIRLMKLESFTITRDAVNNPEMYLDEYIKKNYKA